MDDWLLSQIGTINPSCPCSHASGLRKTCHFTEVGEDLIAILNVARSWLLDPYIRTFPSHTTALFMLFLSSTELRSMATAAEIRSKLIGSWSLLSSRTELRDKPSDEPTILYTIGEDAQGIIAFSADGFVTTQLMRPGARKWESNNLLAGTPEELADTARHFLAYAGTFDVEVRDNGEPVVHVDVNLSSFPNWLGDRQERVVSFQGGTLTLRPPSFTLQVG
jgi:hypothetical protein